VTYTTHDTQMLYDAVIEHLATATGRQIGDGEAPKVDGQIATLPYAVVYALEDEPPEPALSDQTLTIHDAFQVTSVGASAEQARWMQIKVRAALIGWTPDIEGVGTFPIQWLSGGSVLRSDDVQPPLYSAIDRFVARLSG
jgi:hypothetical protein